MKEISEEIKKELIFEPEGRWFVGKTNLLNVVRGSVQFPKKVVLKDETIREGSETPGVHVSMEEKLRILDKLEAVGLTEMEVGYVGSIQEDYDFARLLIERGTKIKLISHARAYSKNWKAEVDRVVESGITTISFVMYAKESRLAALPWIKKADVPKRIEEVVTYSKKAGLYTAIGAGTTAKTELSVLVDCLDAAENASVDRFYVYDGQGSATPETISFSVKLAKDLTSAQIAVHCHNDFGLATANTIEAFKAGAEVLDVVVNGLGDRAGNAALEEVATALTVLYQVDTGIKLESLYELSKLVEEIYGIPIPKNKPLVGDNAYRHATESHIADILRGSWYVQENIRADAIGRERIIEFGPKAVSTRMDGAVAAKMESMGFRFDAKVLEMVVKKIEEIIRMKKYATEAEVEAIIRGLF